MNHILIVGPQWAGKAETIKEVCRRLKPATVRKIFVPDCGPIAFKTLESDSGISHGNYIVTVRNKNILIVSGSPTEQRVSITKIVDAVCKLNLKPDLAIVAARKYERLQNFSTPRELEKFGRCIHESKIWRIPSIKYHLTEEWNKRVSYLTAITLHNI